MSFLFLCFEFVLFCALPFFFLFCFVMVVLVCVCVWLCWVCCVSKIIVEAVVVCVDVVLFVFVWFFVAVLSFLFFLLVVYGDFFEFSCICFLCVK